MKEIERLTDENALITSNYEQRSHEIHQKATTKEATMRSYLVPKLRQLAVEENLKVRLTIAENNLRFGSVSAGFGSNLRSGTIYENFRVDGWEITACKRLLSALSEEKEEIERAKKVLHKKKLSLASSQQTSTMITDKDEFEGFIHLEHVPSVSDIYAEEELLKLRMTIIKKVLHSLCVIVLYSHIIGRD
jgi:hypothetical protein